MKNEILRTLLKYISINLTVVLFIILGMCLYMFISLNILSKKYASFFSYTMFQIASNSMAPTITTDDLILVKITKDVGVNDVITFSEGKILVTHRVISETSNGFITKGDANNQKDKHVTYNQVIGKVIRIYPKWGVWFKVFTTPKIIFLVCFTLFMFSIAFSYTEKKILTKDDDFAIYHTGISLKKGD